MGMSGQKEEGKKDGGQPMVQEQQEDGPGI